MNRTLLTIAWHDLKLELRQKETIVWSFLLPPVFFWFIGTVTAGFSSGGGPSQPWLALRSGDESGFLAEALDQRFQDAGFRTATPDGDADGVPFEEYRRRVEIPEGFTETVLSGEPATVVLRRREGGLGAELDTFRAQRATYGLLADLVALEAEDREPSAEALDDLRGRERAIAIDVTTAGNLESIPTGFQQAVPGTMVMFTLVILLTSGASTLIAERRSGVMRRLAAAPVRRSHVYWGKWLARFGLGVLQTAFAVAIGSLLFGVDWGAAPLGLVLVLGAYAALVSSLGMLLGSLARTESQAIGIAVISANLLAALGGCWWPIEITPRWTQELALFTPTGATMDALHALMSFGEPTAAVLGHVAALALAAVAVGLVAARALRFA